MFKIYFYFRYLILTLLMVVLLGSSKRLSSVFSSSSSSPSQILEKTIRGVESIQTLQYRLTTEERLYNEVHVNESRIKLSYTPYKIYLQQLPEESGAEVMYKEKEFEGKAVINPNGFPWITLWLDPLGYRLRQGKHHHLKRAGYHYFIKLMKHIIDENKDRLDQVFSLHKTVKEGGIDCYKIVYNNPDYQYISYTVKEGESIPDIAEKYKISEYKILEENASLTYYNQSLDPGMTITIPTDYAQRIKLFIDKQRYIPVTIEVYDDKGLLESFKFREIQINPDFESQTFELDNPAYDF